MSDSVVVALALMGLIGVVGVTAIIRYEADGASKIWGGLSGLIGIMTGSFVTFFFTHPQIESANESAALARAKAIEVEESIEEKKAKIDELTTLIQTAPEDKTVSELKSEKAFVAITQQSDSDWFAVIGSYPSSNLDGARAFGRRVAAEYKRNVKIYRTKIAGNYAVILEGPMHRSAAIDLSKVAIEQGIAADAFAQADRNWSFVEAIGFKNSEPSKSEGGDSKAIIDGSWVKPGYFLWLGEEDRLNIESISNRKVLFNISGGPTVTISEGDEPVEAKSSSGVIYKVTLLRIGGAGWNRFVDAAFLKVEYI